VSIMHVLSKDVCVACLSKEGQRHLFGKYIIALMLNLLKSADSSVSE